MWPIFVSSLTLVNNQTMWLLTPATNSNRYDVWFSRFWWLDFPVLCFLHVWNPMGDQIWHFEEFNLGFLANVNSRSRSLYAIARPSGCLSSVVCLSVCNARAPYSGGWNFRQYFYGIRYFAIQWHPLKILQRSSQENPSAGGVKHKRGNKI